MERERERSSLSPEAERGLLWQGEAVALEVLFDVTKALFVAVTDSVRKKKQGLQVPEVRRQYDASSEQKLKEFAHELLRIYRRGTSDIDPVVTAFKEERLVNIFAVELGQLFGREAAQSLRDMVASRQESPLIEEIRDAEQSMIEQPDPSKEPSR